MTSFGDADDESEELPSRILADISPRKEHAVGTPGRPRTHMIMEVVLETPRQHSLQKSDGNTHLPEGSGSDDVPEPAPDSIPLAQR
ncbi:hypothetical protein FRC11_001794 [Ceratobasidium sp. 423]|nr:hypothetical protein FRC11_001794 [Ceratobasidium sp. 423]